MSLSAQVGTHARFNPLPSENATCGHVKVLQRVPFKIALMETPSTPYRIGPGMSVEMEVHAQ